jgi:hypothetical protein
MIAPASPEPSNTPEQSGTNGKGGGSSGGQGAILADPHHTRADARMVAMAARKAWPISRSKRQLCVERLASVIESSADDSTAIAAIKALATLDSINVKREQGPTQTSVAVGVSVAMSQSVEAALHEPEYLDWLESRGDSHTVRTAGNGGPVSDSAPPASN